MKRLRIPALLVVACWSVSAQEFEKGAPSQTFGITSTVRGSIPLKPYAGSREDGQLRAREVVLEPGAKIAVHAHDDHPALVYVLEGELVEHRNDSDRALVRRQGDVYLEGHDVVHWVENVSPNPVRALSVDIIPDAPE